MRQGPDRSDAAARRRRGLGLSPLGPPGWEEFSAARERFMRTVTVAGLETAWDAPAQDPRSRDWGGRRRVILTGVVARYFDAWNDRDPVACGGLRPRRGGEWRVLAPPHIGVQALPAVRRT